jgi:hypothetical protein
VDSILRNSFLRRCKKLALWKQTAALIDQIGMPCPAHWFETFEPITADFTCVRWLRARKEILPASFPAREVVGCVFDS